MNIYLIQTEFAARNLIDLINSDESILNNHKSTLAALKNHHQFLYSDFLRKDFDPDDHYNDHQMMYAFAKQASFYQEQIEPLERKINEITSSISAKQESLKALSGALLQLAKQGISIVHGSLDNCVDGRIIKNEPLKNIIWQGRNQSMHYEEGRYRQAVIDCFNNIGLPLRNDNLAKEIIGLLGWKSYKQYELDLISLLG